MSDFALSVVIPTYNRPDLIVRAVNSVVAARSVRHKIEIIVVDDASTAAQPELAIDDLIYHRMPVNGGPGPARMKGLELARAPWVLIFDDDDTLEPDAAEYLAAYLPEPENSTYPVYQFVSKGTQKEDFHLITLDDYMNKVITGDFTPVFNREQFLSSGLQYPKNRAGGEHLLWWKIAETFGLPSYNRQLVRMSDDAAVRLTHLQSQINNAIYHQQLAEMTLADFGEQLRSHHPAEYCRVRLAHITYNLLSNQRTTARQSLKDPLLDGKLKIALWTISWLPLSLIKRLFLLYRQRQG